ncbi:hypothetical protein MACJ_000781 [Theileria orientalis]|uniref:Uncharacterized protein n=1 Tax=Theileria orientalis TaxID=68886 RepID=A0A976M4N2_THEOR|nr:hypothetical protein MACJ_000781 [Theileria orientalis]
MALNKSNLKITTTLWRMYNQGTQTLAIRNLKRRIHLHGMCSMLDSGSCKTLIINQSLYPEIVLDILAEAANSQNKLTELYIDSWNVDYERFITLLRECIGAHQESLEVLTVKCRLPMDYLTMMFDFIPKTLKILDLSDNDITDSAFFNTFIKYIRTSDLEVIRFVNCKMKPHLINELVKLILKIEIPFALKKVDGLDFSTCDEIPKCVRQTMTEPLKLTRKRQMNYRDYSTIDNNEVSSHFMDYIRNVVFMKRLVGMDVRVWWPATKDDNRTSFAGRLWPAKIIMANPVDLIFVVKYDNDDIDHVPCKYVQPKNPFKYGGGLEPNYIYHLTGSGGNINGCANMKKELESNNSRVRVNNNDGRGNCGGSIIKADGFGSGGAYKSSVMDKTINNAGLGANTVVTDCGSKGYHFRSRKKNDIKVGGIHNSHNSTENVLSSRDHYKNSGVDRATNELLRTPEKTKTMTTSQADLTSCASARYTPRYENEFVCIKCGFVNNVEMCMRSEVDLESVESILGLDEKFKGNLLVPGEFCEFRDPLDQFRNDPSDYIGVVTKVNESEPLYECVCIYQDNEELISVYSKDVRRTLVVPWYNWVELTFKLLLARRKVFDKLKHNSPERKPSRYMQYSPNTSTDTMCGTSDYVVDTPVKINSKYSIDTSSSTTATPSHHSLSSFTPRELKFSSSSDAVFSVSESAESTPNRTYEKRDYATADGFEIEEETTPWGKLFEEGIEEYDVLNTSLYYLSPIKLEDLNEYLPPNPLEMKLITLNSYANLVCSKIKNHPKLHDDGTSNQMDTINLKLKSLTEFNEILQKELQYERDKNIELQSKFKCILCFDTEINCVLDPCTHFSFCHE